MAAGCGTAAHDRAVRQAKAWARAHDVSGRVTCSSGLKAPAGMSAKPDFICLVRRSPLDCTVLHVSVPARIRVIRRHADCVQPL